MPRRSRLHIPQHHSRPGEEPDFSYLETSPAGAVRRPDVNARVRDISHLSVEMVRVLDDEHRPVGPWNPHLDPPDLQVGLRHMLLTRIFDERMQRAQRSGKISFYMRSLGEEAVSVAQGMALRPGDMLFPSYRNQGLYIVRGKPLVYLDSANTAQKPAAVIDAVDGFYRRHNANVSRAVHQLGAEATEAYEGARRKIAAFFNIHPDDLVLTSGTTQSINLVAYSFALPRLQPGDVILVTRMEHHANMVPWQLIAERTGAHILPVEITPEGELDLPALKAQLKAPAKILALSHVSNVLGTVNPVAQICEWARKAGITTVIDGSQAAPHMAVDIPSLGCDFYAFTGHKMCGPTGTGGLWAKRGHL